MTYPRFQNLAWVALAAASLVPTHASATVMEELSFERLAREADAVVRGVVVQVGSHVALYGTAMEPMTVTTLRVSSWLKGSGAAHVRIRERGGEWQGGGMWIDGTPRYRVGEDVVVFLRRDPEAPQFFRTYGMAQGKFIVIPGAPGVPATLHRELSEMALVRWESGNMVIETNPAESRLQLDNLLDLIARVARGGAP